MHTHRFVRYVLRQVHDRMSGFHSIMDFSPGVDGYYVGYECHCGEQGYAVR